MFVQLVCTLIVGFVAASAIEPNSESVANRGHAMSELKLRLLERLLSELAAAEQLDTDAVCGSL